MILELNAKSCMLFPVFASCLDLVKWGYLSQWFRCVFIYLCIPSQPIWRCQGQLARYIKGTFERIGHKKYKRSWRSVHFQVSNSNRLDWVPGITKGRWNDEQPQDRQLCHLRLWESEAGFDFWGTWAVCSGGRFPGNGWRRWRQHRSPSQDSAAWRNQNLTNCESRNTRWIWWWVTWRCSGLPTPRAALPIQPQSARGNSDDQDRRATCTARSKSPRPRWRELQPPKVAAHLRLFLPCAASSPWVSSAPCRRAPVSSILFCQIPFGFDKSPGRSLLGLWS